MTYLVKFKSKHQSDQSVYDLRGADDPPLVLAPVHAQHLVAVSLQSPPCLHDKLAQAFHLLGHLMHWTQKIIDHLINLPSPPIDTPSK